MSFMAEEANNDDKVKVIEECQVRPPSGSVLTTSIPLSYLDFPWFDCPLPLQKPIFFYDFPYSTQHFLQTVLPILKHSLSLTLQHFFPLAANIVLPPKPHTPHILYSKGDFISLTVAESTIDFNHLVSNSPRHVTHAHPFVPLLPPSRVLEDGTLMMPSMAIQVTVFPNFGFSLCLTFRHVIADARSFMHFMKFWALVCKTKGDLALVEASLCLPFHYRGMIEDPNGLRPIFLEELWNNLDSTSYQVDEDDASRDIVRHIFTFKRQQVEKFKKWTAFKCKSIGLEILHLSTFVVISSLMWVCMVKSEDMKLDTVPDDEYCSMNFVADCRNLYELSIPSNYFGNCLTKCNVEIQRSKLVGENGVFEAVNVIGRGIRNMRGNPLKGVDSLMTSLSKRELGEKLENVVRMAGSTKLNVYETDFGWGKPKMGEVLHLDHNLKVMCLCDSREQECAVEVGLVLKEIQMEKFTTILEEQLRDIVLD
ncbi:hypothetical protein RJT34_18428 [Clitoria ternatea]|uniref:Anthocyanin acyltransferase n=1 Tax=Clitoria ternatea TaxID=43366 RepID=A0AAN9PFF5_CLITE